MKKVGRGPSTWIFTSPSLTLRLVLCCWSFNFVHSFLIILIINFAFIRIVKLTESVCVRILNRNILEKSLKYLFSCLKIVKKNILQMLPDPAEDKESSSSPTPISARRPGKIHIQQTRVNCDGGADIK